MKQNGFILMVVLIFTGLLSLLIERAYLSVNTEKNLETLLITQHKLFAQAQLAIRNAEKNQVSCNKNLCVKILYSHNQKIIQSKANENNVLVFIQAVYINHQKFSWQQLSS